MPRVRFRGAITASEPSEAKLATYLELAARIVAAPTDDADYSLPSIDEILGDDGVDGI